MTRGALLLLALTLVAYAVLAFGYATRTPIWQNPDEPAHFNYVAFVARTGGLPVLEPGDWDSGLLSRVQNGALQPGDSISSIRYESWQPPLFYLLAAPVFKAGPVASDAPLPVVLRLRLLNAVFGGITLVLAYCVAREVFDPLLAVAVPLIITGVPMFTAVSASVSADPLANLMAAALFLALVWRVARPRTEGLAWAVVTGVLLGFGLLTKLELAIFVPLAIGVVVLKSQSDSPRRLGVVSLTSQSDSPRPPGVVSPKSQSDFSRPSGMVAPTSKSDWPRVLREALVILAIAAVLVSPWLVHQVTSYGWTDPLATTRHAQVVADQPRFPGFSLDWLGQFLTISFHSFWAQFGWMAIVASTRLYVIWGAFVVLALIGLVLKRDWLRQPVWQLLLATVVITFLAYVGYNLDFEQFQSRYLFTAIVPIAALMARGWSTLPPPRAQPWTTLALAAALVALNAYALVRVLEPGFAPTG